jgi:hypothetical protein
LHLVSTLRLHLRLSARLPAVGLSARSSLRLPLVSTALRALSARSPFLGLRLSARFGRFKGPRLSAIQPVLFYEAQSLPSSCRSIISRRGVVQGMGRICHPPPSSAAYSAWHHSPRRGCVGMVGMGKYASSPYRLCEGLREAATHLAGASTPRPAGVYKMTACYEPSSTSVISSATRPCASR